MSARDEAARISLLRRILDGSSAHVAVGNGDDAAVLEVGGSLLVWSIDAAVEGVHFTSALMSLEDVGYRATMAALSDLAAMGATPLGVLAALELPSSLDDASLEALARGQRAAVDRVGTTVLGGNLARSEKLAVTTTVLGRSTRALTRSGARPGDVLWLAGAVGLAGAGLEAARRGIAARGAVGLALEAFRRPEALIDAGLVAVRDGASGALDVSDGLALDAGRMALASGVRLELEAEALVTGPLRDAAAELGLDALSLALGGGEDYALLAALPEGVQPAGFVPIGRCTPGPAEVVVRHADGSLHPARGGWDHFG
jgi:thiamine-monophosphate kinase